MIIILAFCATYYDTSITRTRRNVRDDLTREVAKKGLVTDLESAMWINNFSQSSSLYPPLFLNVN